MRFGPRSPRSSQTSEFNMGTIQANLPSGLCHAVCGWPGVSTVTGRDRKLDLQLLIVAARLIV